MTPGDSIRRYRRIGFTSLFISSLVCAATMFTARLQPWLAAATLIPPLVVLIILWILEPDVREVLREADHRVCPGCLYDLTASPPDGPCPECGRPYTRQNLIDHWTREFNRSRKLAPKQASGERIVIRSPRADPTSAPTATPPPTTDTNK